MNASSLNEIVLSSSDQRFECFFGQFDRSYACLDEKRRFDRFVQSWPCMITSTELLLYSCSLSPRCLTMYSAWINRTSKRYSGSYLKRWVMLKTKCFHQVSLSVGPPPVHQESRWLNQCSESTTKGVQHRSVDDVYTQTENEQCSHRYSYLTFRRRLTISLRAQCEVDWMEHLYSLCFLSLHFERARQRCDRRSSSDFHVNSRGRDFRGPF